MTGVELYKCVKYKDPVRYTVDTMPGVILYARCVLSVVYSRDRLGRMLVSAELLDLNGCLVRVPARNVSYLGFKELISYRKERGKVI